MRGKQRDAFEFSRKAHEGQKRKGTDKDYFIHPLKVHEIVRCVIDKEDILCAALLHDVIEDTEYTYEDIKKIFGKQVADIVLEVTKDKKRQFNIKTREGLIVKLADILHNIHNSKDKEYINEKMKFIKEIDENQKI
jgi:(p)ppGpp synthase/HD superfamily hydrolase|tara:strand:+ start:648 stop:1055 length:408 start_codon:yes stop_codon:yes gene_type:complete